MLYVICYFMKDTRPPLLPTPIDRFTTENTCYPWGCRFIDNSKPALNEKIDELVSQIIPPNNYQHRHEFNNAPIIDKLNEEEKGLIVNGIIEKLKAARCDYLVIDTLVYLRAYEAIPELYECFKYCTKPGDRLVLASAIFQLNGDAVMENIAMTSVMEMNKAPDRKRIYWTCFYLAPFNTKRVNDILADFVSDEDFFIAANAKRALAKNGIDFF